MAVMQRKRRDKWQAGRDSGFCTEPHIAQPPYSPDFAPSDFWLCPTLNVGLKGTRFVPMEDIKSNVTAKLRKIPKEAFRRCYNIAGSLEQVGARARVLF
jgi:hypothetical protein